VVRVPTQCRLTAHDLLLHYAADDNSDRFLNLEPEEFQKHPDHVSGKGLMETLKHGICYYHEALDWQDKRIAQLESGVIQVLVASKDTAWSLSAARHMVIIMGAQSYEAKEHRHIDNPAMDVLQMMGRPCRPRKDSNSRWVLMRQQTRNDFYKKFLAEGLPVDSHLPAHLLYNYSLAEIAVKTTENKQDATDILTVGGSEEWDETRRDENLNDIMLSM